MISHFPTKRNTKAENLLSLKRKSTEGALNDAAAAEAGAGESGVDVPECVEMREELLQQVSGLKLPPHFLDGAPPNRAQVAPRLACMLCSCVAREGIMLLL